MAKLVIIFALAFNLISCSNAPCNNLPQNKENLMAAQAAEDKAIPAPEEPKLRGKTVLVFKPTGELQCGGGQVISLKDAESQLARLSVKTTDGHTQSDKKMRVTVCGAPNGQIHVFSIQAKDLRIAEKSGFKKLAEPSRP